MEYVQPLFGRVSVSGEGSPYQLILPFFGIERIPEAVSEKIQGKERQRKEECRAKQ